MRCEFLKAHRGEFGPIKKACEILKVSKSEYYDYVKRRKSNAQIEREALDEFVAEKFEVHKGRYGYRRINRELRKDGIVVSEKRVLNVMRKLGLQAKGATRKHRRARVVEAGDPRVNLVDRMFEVDARNRLWVGDITYIGTSEGWLYLAVVMDAWHRKVVGWSMSERITEKLAVDALEQAAGREDPPCRLQPRVPRRPGRPVHVPRVPALPGVPRDSPVDVEARQPVGQCARRVLLQDFEAGAGEGEKIQDERRSEAGCLQVHRALLQQGEDAFCPWLQCSLRLRARCSLRILK